MSKNNKNMVYFPFKIDVKNSSLQFIETTYNVLKTRPFHDRRLLGEKSNIKQIQFDDISDLPKNQAVSYIFHTAFCGSTFLSRLLGESEGFFSVREPSVLMEVANLIRTKSIGQGEVVNSLQKIVAALGLLAAKKEQLVIKPTNAANNLIPQLLNSTENSKALMLYLDLDDFLISILKKGEVGKSFIRNLYNVLSLDNSPFVLSDFRQVNTMTDLQIACLVWSMQMYEYKQVEENLKLKLSNRIKFLNTSEFLNNPKQAIVKISRFFGNEISSHQIKLLEEQSNFSYHAKFKDKHYNSEIRQQEKQRIKNKYREDIEEIHQWIDRFLKPPKIPSQAFHLID